MELKFSRAAIQIDLLRGTSCVVVFLFGLTGARGASVDSVLREQVRKHYPQLQQCYRRALAIDRQLAGTTFLSLTMGRRGAVTRAKLVRDTELKMPGVVDCLLGEVRGWVLPTLQSAGVRVGDKVILPLTFKSDPDQYLVRVDDVAVEHIGVGTSQVLLSEKNVGAADGITVDLRTYRRPSILKGPLVGVVLSGRGLMHHNRVESGSAFYLGSAEQRIRVKPSGEFRVLLVRGAVRAASQAHMSESPVIVARKNIKGVRLAGGKLVVTPLIERRMVKQQSIYLGWLYAKSGFRVPSHQHAGSAELLYVVRGSGQMNVSRKKANVVADSAIYIKKNAVHDLKVEQDLEVVQIYVPAGPEQRFFKPFSTNSTKN